MNKDLITKYRMLLGGIEAKKEELAKKKERLEELNEDPTIKEYFRLLNDDKVKEYFSILEELNDDCNYVNDEEALRKIYNSIHKDITETNEIYVCLGRSYPGYYDMGKIWIASDVPEDRKILVTYYKNLEKNTDGLFIEDRFSEEFEKTHTVLPITIHEANSTYESKYGKLSLEFLRDIIELGNEKAKEKLFSKYK